jgi:hypothetical protein
MTWPTVARALYGVSLLVRPDRALRIATSAPPTRPATIVVRVLGARHLAQAALTARWPTSQVQHAGAAIDVLHAITDIGFARVDRRYRRAAALDAAIASGFATAGLFVRSRSA